MPYITRYGRGWVDGIPRSWSAKLHEYTRLSQSIDLIPMTSPPTVTMGSTGAASSITSAQSVSIFNGTASQATINTHGKFRISGAAPAYRLFSGNPAVQPWNINGQTGMTSISGMHYGSAMEWILWGNGTGFYRLWIDDQPVTATMQNGTGGTNGRHYLHVNFGSSAWRRVRIDVDNQSVSGVNIGPTDTWLKDDGLDGLRLLVMSDSYGSGTGAAIASTGESWIGVCSRLLGCRDVAVATAGGTGLTAAGSWGTYATRFAASAALLTSPPDVVIIQGSTNDNGATAGTVTAAATSLVSAVRAAYPSAYVAVLGLLYDTARSGAALTNHNEVIAVSGADLVIDTVGGVEGAWWSGTGRVGSTTGSGNGDIFMSADGIHPTTAGHQHLGSRVAARLRTAWTSLPIR